jgi:hypothetical protein
VHQQQDQQNSPGPGDTRLVGGCLLVLLVLIGMVVVLWAALDAITEGSGF